MLVFERYIYGLCPECGLSMILLSRTKEGVGRNVFVLWVYVCVSVCVCVYEWSAVNFITMGVAVALATLLENNWEGWKGTCVRPDCKLNSRALGAHCYLIKPPNCVTTVQTVCRHRRFTKQLTSLILAFMTVYKLPHLFSSFGCTCKNWWLYTYCV